MISFEKVEIISVNFFSNLNFCKNRKIYPMGNSPSLPKNQDEGNI